MFKISATDLKAASGHVRCGACLEIFDALRSLSEDHTTLTSTTHNPAGTVAPPSNAISADTGANSSPPHFSAQTEAAADQEQLDTIIAEVAEPDHVQTNSAPSNEDAITALAPHMTAPAELAATHAAKSGQEDLTASDKDFFSQLERQRTWTGRSWLWTLGAAAMAVLLLAQGLYYFRNDLAAQSQLRPMTEQFCAALGCTLALRREPGLISPVSRNVRIHPSSPEALLIESTFINNASYTQPFPLLELSFYNLQGQAIASRVFTPEEYLAQDHDLIPGIKPQERVAVTLEIADPGKEAVSFEFDFY